MELQSALEQIAQIHRQMSLTRTFRGYRAATALFTAAVAVAAGIFQCWWMPDPRQSPQAFVDLWIAVAIVCLIVVAFEMVQRYGRTDSPLQKQLTLQAVEHFLPSIVIGGAVTFLICQYAHECRWLLPGLWEIFFGMGICASRQLLPPKVFYVGVFYLFCGLLCMGGLGPRAYFSPWAIAAPFAVGQSAAAIVLHWTLERRHESE